MLHSITEKKSIVTTNNTDDKVSMSTSSFAGAEVSTTTPNHGLVSTVTNKKSEVSTRNQLCTVVENPLSLLNVEDDSDKECHISKTESVLKNLSSLCRRKEFEAFKHLYERHPDVLNKLYKLAIYGNSHYLVFIADLNKHIPIIDFLSKKNPDITREMDTDSKCKFLHLAISTGSFDLVKVLIETDKDNVNTLTNKNGYTPLHTAVIHGQPEITRYLINNGANINRTTGSDLDATPLHLAIFRRETTLFGGNRDMQVISCLLTNNADLSAVREETAQKVSDCLNLSHCMQHPYRTPFHDAIILQDLVALKYLESNGYDSSSLIDDRGLSHLHYAAITDNTEIFTWLSDKNRDRIKPSMPNDINCLTTCGLSPIHFAVFHESIKIIEHIIMKQGDINVVDEDNRTPLHIACYSESIEVIELLLNANATVNSLTKDNKSPLYIAIEKQNVDAVRLLIKHEADVNLRINNTPLLHFATAKGNVEIVELLILNKAMINARCQNETTALIYAVKNGYDEIIDVLLKAGADVNCQTKNKISPIYMAAKSGNLSIAKKLIKAGCNIHILNGKSQISPMIIALQNKHTAIADLLALTIGAQTTPLHLALIKKKSYSTNPDNPTKKEREKYLNTLKSLIDSGADVNAKDVTNLTPLHLAIQENSLDALKYLVIRGANLDTESPEGDSMLMYAIRHQSMPIVKHLINENLSLSCRNKNGWSPIILAGFTGNTDMVDLLLKNGADINECSQNIGSTVLHIACTQRNLPMIKHLISNGINVNACSHIGNTSPLTYCEVRHFHEGAKFLLANGAKH